MAQEVTLGGERLGSGNQMKQELYNYGMNSFNQSRDWKSTMAPGILYPCFKEIGTNHGTFDIDIDAFVRTLPTVGPLFGSFKMQIDLFNVPFRLYQGVLHNNPVDIGLNMNRVYLPRLEFTTMDGGERPRVKGATEDDEQVSTNALLKYMGISGIGHSAQQQTVNMIKRELQCVPELGYYDIFKNYYSNKQEENAYVIVPGQTKAIEPELNTINYDDNDYNPEEEITMNVLSGQFFLNGTNLTKENVKLNVEPYVGYYINATLAEIQKKCLEYDPTGATPGIAVDFNRPTSDGYLLIIWLNDIYRAFGHDVPDPENEIKIEFSLNEVDPEYLDQIKLEPFALKNIDKMRARLLACNELDDVFKIKFEGEDTNTWGIDSGFDGTGLPYSTLVYRTNEGITYNAFQMNGLVVKTYQSDLFNNWLDNSLVDTIAQRTKIDTTSGGFTPDTLILQEKIYKLLNRILVSGGTYYDWQEATYGEGVARMSEIPMYIGGMSTEIVFEEVIANSESYAGGQYQALGSLGGKGMNNGKKGGNNIHVRMDEPGYIIGICSITPRISVSQGNDWDRTELLTMDDLHKPELDGIGFQDLMVEQMAWWNTVLTPSAGGGVIHRDAVGKQTAWINYQTAVDKVFGDFAKQDGYSFMVLSRNYEHEGTYGVRDLTTYIDPSKYNYAFAYKDLASQNFWVQLNFKCVSRRKMGAQQLPTL